MKYIFKKWSAEILGPKLCWSKKIVLDHESYGSKDLFVLKSIGHKIIFGPIYVVVVVVAAVVL